VKYLVTGQAGSGKSSVAAELCRRGFVAYDTDAMPGVSGFDYAATGSPAPPGTGEISHPIDFTRFAWNWRVDRLHELLASAEDVFICAITSNAVSLRHLFDVVYVLTLDGETLLERLRARTDHDFGKDPDEAAAVLRHNGVIGDEWRERGGVLLDATRPIRDIVDDILARMR
jgi:broad-specificity NMP kinase